MPELELTDTERDLILAHRTAAEAKKQKVQQGEKPADIDDIKPNMSPATKQKIMDRIMQVWSK
jgi:hypothetical protein